MAKAKATATSKPSAPPAHPPSASAPAASSAPPAAVDQARGPRARLRGTDHDPKAIVIATKVYVHVYTTGPRASLIAMPLHEVPLARRKVELLHQQLHIDPSWPEGGLPRVRDLSPADLQHEYERLRLQYVFTIGEEETQKYDLVADFYGRPHEGRLVTIIRRLHAAYEKLRVEHRDDEADQPWPLKQWQDLVHLSEPEQDYIVPPA